MIYALTERKLGISDQVQCVVTIVLHCYRDIGRVVQEKREFLRKSRNLDTKKKTSHVNILAKLGNAPTTQENQSILACGMLITNLLSKL